MNVLVLVGSLRPGAFNAQLADVAVRHLPRDTEVTFFAGLGELPHYSEHLDAEGSVPQLAADLRAAVGAADAIVVTTPEYNGSVSSVVKNAIDWVSRPRGAAALAGKPAAVLAASASPRGGLWAREDAVKILTVAGAEVLADTVGVGSAWEAFAEGRLVDAGHDKAVAALIGQLVEPLVAAA